MARLGNTINPNMNTDLRSQKAQGANVGDMAYASDNMLYRWSGVNWEQEPNHMQDRVTMPPSPDEYVAELIEELVSGFDNLDERAALYDTENPFSFDELLARASAKETFSPFYDAELKDFLDVIGLQRQDVRGEQNLITELNDLAQVKEKRGLQEAIDKSEKGFAGAGLFTGGQRRRETGLSEIRAKEAEQERESRVGRQREGTELQLGQYNVQEREGRRKSKAGLESTLQQDVAGQKAEQRAAHEYEKAQVLGPEYTSKYQGGINELLSYAYQ